MDKIIETKTVVSLTIEKTTNILSPKKNNPAENIQTEFEKISKIIEPLILEELKTQKNNLNNQKIGFRALIEIIQEQTNKDGIFYHGYEIRSTIRNLERKQQLQIDQYGEVNLMPEKSELKIIWDQKILNSAKQEARFKRGGIITITPEEFLELAPDPANDPELEGELDEDTILKYQEKIEQGQEIPPIFLDLREVEIGEFSQEEDREIRNLNNVNPETEILLTDGHDGRHRAEAARRLGIEQIEVLIAYYATTDKNENLNEKNYFIYTNNEAQYGLEVEVKKSR